MRQLKLILIFAWCIVSTTHLFAQDLDYTNPKQYEIGGINVIGTEHLDKKVLISLSGLSVGDMITVPGQEISSAVKNLWNQRLFTDVSISIDKTLGNVIFLNIDLVELPRLSKYSIAGVKKGEIEELRKKINLRSGSIFTESDKLKTENTIKSFYIDKGFYNTNVNIVESDDNVLENSIKVDITIDKGRKVKIDHIDILGNKSFSERKLEKQMKDTREKVKFELAELLNIRKNKKSEEDLKFFKTLSNLSVTKAIDYGDDFVNLNIFKTSKFKLEDYEADKKKLIAFYKNKGFRDAKITYDEVTFDEEGEANIKLLIKEGNLYYFRDIDFTGNSKYSDSLLIKILNIEKGTVYSQSVLDEKLFMSQDGGDISSLYMDDGYLFFNITPVEKRIVNDSVDLELKIYEGPQAIINEVRIFGNTKTNEKVIRRELYVYPGDKFSRSNLIRSQRQISNLGYFDPEQMEVIPIPNPENGTVDIEFRVVEKPSDQLELSLGWGGRGAGLVGTLGVQFTNFSLRNIGDKKAWSPLPSGDGQNLTVRAQLNGKQFQSYNFSFTEPWLGGKKPNSFTVSFFRQRYNLLSNTLSGDVLGKSITTGGSVGIGTRLKWPDDFFTIRSAINVNHYKLDDFSLYSNFPFTTGSATDLNLSTTLARNSIDNPLFPRRGSTFSFQLDMTLPYSKLFAGRKNIDYTSSETSAADKYKLIEYHKWRVNADWYTPIVGNLILHTSAKLGFLGTYNKDLGVTPFERYQLGGQGFNTFTILGTDIIGMRGYDVITPNGGAPIMNKYSMELRYPISLNPSATVYALGFFEAGNYWNSIKEYKPYELKRSFGAGLRVFLPMFGLLGFDYGIGFDDTDLNALTGKNLFSK
ncbi:MAG: BamA/TamA family outer membrane protein, partial [Bacteroidetes bacterium]|nr:BamA/TamA family outer membrane protein [Bacteroidota bacterium]